MNEYLQGNTLVDYPRLYKLEEFLKETEHLPGIIAEIGVYRGGSARWICERTTKHVLLFDTFEGLPTVAHGIDTHHKGDFSNTSMQHVHSVLGPCSNYSLHKGVFPKDNSEYAENSTFSLVHIDVDIYPSVIDCLNFFIPRMDKGGIIVLDDYNAPSCPGAKLAADQVATIRGLTVESTVQCQAIIRL